MSVGSVGGGTFTLMVSLICLIISVVLLLVFCGGEIGAIMDKKRKVNTIQLSLKIN